VGVWPRKPRWGRGPLKQVRGENSRWRTGLAGARAPESEHRRVTDYGASARPAYPQFLWITVWTISKAPGVNPHKTRFMSFWLKSKHPEDINGIMQIACVS